MIIFEITKRVWKMELKKTMIMLIVGTSMIAAA